MPLNFNIIQPQESAKIIAQGAPAQAPELPSDDGGGDGISGLLGGIGKMLKGGVAPMTNPTTSGTGGLRGLLGGPQAPPQNPMTQQINIQAPNQFKSGTPQSLGPVPQDVMQSPAYQNSLKAYSNAQQSGIAKSPYMTVVDFSKPSTDKRLWVVDPKTSQVMMNTQVSQGSGGFSNTPGSHASSLGTYVTGAAYEGKNGRSLRIQGLDPGVNDKAMERDIVAHGADYASKGGRSFGCFAMPRQDAQKFIDLTQGGSVIHAYAPDKTYNDTSFLSNPSVAPKILGNPQNNPFSNFKTNRASQNPTQPSGATLAPGATQVPGPGGSSPLDATMQSISKIESGGSKNPYNLVGPNTGSMGRALGKYQIMEKNVGPWSQQHLGRKISRDEFLANPQYQEQIARGEIGRLQEKYGPNGAARAWFAGEGGMNRNTSKDAFGTSVKAYSDKFNQYYNQARPAVPMKTSLNTDEQIMNRPDFPAMNNPMGNTDHYGGPGGNFNSKMPQITPNTNTTMPGINDTPGGHDSLNQPPAGLLAFMRQQGVDPWESLGNNNDIYQSRTLS